MDDLDDVSDLGLFLEIEVVLRDDQIEEIAFLIGNKKAETFQLLIDKIVLK